MPPDNLGLYITESGHRKMLPLSPSTTLMANCSSSACKLIILISGRGSNMEAVLEHISRHQLPVDVAAVISDQPNAAGLKTAKRLGIQTSVLERRPKELSRQQYDAELTAVAQSYEPDLVLLAGFMRVIGPQFIAAFPQRIINIHPSLLPSFRGLHAQRQALAAGVKFAGCTVHIVVEEVDAGPVLAQAVVPVLTEDTEETLAARILAQEHQILPAVIEAIALGTLELGGRGSVPVFKSEILAQSPETALRSIRGSR